MLDQEELRSERTQKSLWLMAGILVFLAAVLATSSAQSGEDALLQADRDFNKATAEKKLEGWMQFMADDVVLLRGKPVFGKDAAREAIKADWDDPTYSLTWEPKHAELFKSGKMGYTSGRWTYHGKNPKGEQGTLEGDYLTVWKKQADGSWKVIYDGGAADPPTAK
jgi:ketosteroid isomerase-like protein